MDVELAGVVRRSATADRLPAPFAAVPVATHVRDLGRIDAVLLCVPPMDASSAAREILQLRVPLVECAILEAPAARAHYETIAGAARNHHVNAVVGAGWDPGLFPLLQRAFGMLIPKGVTTVTTRPAVSLHHTEAVRNIDGVVDALTTELRDAEGRLTRYVYAELAKAVDPTRVQAELDADPLFAGERTLLVPVASIAKLEHEGQGTLLERRGTAGPGAHQNILFEARFDVAAFAARVMLDAARQLPHLKPGMHRYSLWASSPP
jgi:diaminopimelate dehydrogenase